MGDYWESDVDAKYGMGMYEQVDREWVCRYDGTLTDEPCSPETGGNPGTLHRDCGWN